MTKIFIDGKDGTTGLKIYKRLQERQDVELLLIEDEVRKDKNERKRLINSADICFLCLPDAAAIESVSLVEEGNPVKILDTSTAHRTNSQWSYGFPELSKKHREQIESSSRVAVPGCHASGFNSIVYPLINSGVMNKDYPLVCFSVTGYSGGGKQMICDYEKQERDFRFDSPRQYALSQNHKHLKEMMAVSSLSVAPIFSPIVADYYSGMCVSVPIFTGMLNEKLTLCEIHEIFAQHYKDSKLITVLPLGEEHETGNMLSSNSLREKDTMEIIVSGNDDRVVVASRFDNLGKGASGAAMQCMNIMLGIDEKIALNI